MKQFKRRQNYEHRILFLCLFLLLSNISWYIIKKDLRDDEVKDLKFHYHLIVNPASGGGKGKKHSDTIIELLKKYQFHYTAYFTEFPEHEIAFIDELNQSTLRAWREEERDEAVTFPLVIVVGGDGTLHQVVERLNYLKSQAPVSYIPAGSGNDFARGFGISLDPVQAFWQIIKAQRPQKINIFSYHEQITGKKGVVINSLGIGIDGVIVYQTTKTEKKQFLSSFVYIFPIFKSLFKQKGFPVLIEANGQELNFKKIFLCTMTNHPYLGGGIPLAPMADSQSPEFECIVVEKHSFFIIFKLIFLLLLKKQEKSKDYIHFSTNKLRIVSTTQQFCQVDGEVIERNAFDFMLQPKIQNVWFL